MGISGTDAALMFALSGTARSGATRSGWKPVGKRYGTFALSGIARSGATRAGYHSPKVCISVNGVERGWGRTVSTYQVFDLVINDVQNETPSTASFSVKGWTPTVGMDVIIRLGSTANDERLFAGTILTAVQGYVGLPTNQQWAVTCIDYTWGLNKRKVTGHYTGSATTIAQTLISAYASGYTYANIEAGMATVDGGITFTMQDLTDCLTQLKKRIGGEWYCDYTKDVHLWSTADPASITDPTDLTGYHTTFSDFSVSRDLSQVVNRVHVEGGGSAAGSAVAVGETILPVTEAQWYSATGGTVVSGPQRITYTGRSLGGGGGLVGPGAAPSGMLVATSASGAGVEDGAHSYATTFVTAAGESLPSPLTAITLAVTSAPTAAPTAATPTIGTGPDPGSHDYEVTFVTSSGETTPGPSVTRATTLTADPTTGPSAAGAVGAGVEDGTHDYAVSFVTSVGESLAGPIGSQATCQTVVSGYISEPATPPATAAPTTGAGPETGSHDYAFTYVNTAGETAASAIATRITTVGEVPGTAPTAGTPTTGGSVTLGDHDYEVCFVTADGESTPGPASGTVTTTLTYVDAPSSAPTASNNTSDPSTGTSTWSVGDTLYVQIVYVNANGTTTPGPSSNSFVAIVTSPVGAGHPRQLHLVSIPVSSDGTVTGKRVYLNVNSAWTGYWSIDSATTSGDYSSTRTGTTPPGSNTASIYKQTVALSAIPIGPAGTTQRKVYRRFNGTGTYKLLTTLANNTATTFSDTVANAALTDDAPSVNTTLLNRVALSGITTGPSGTTQRKVYRSAVGSSQLKLLTTLSNNSATTFNDTVLDAALTDNIPTTNTTGTGTAYNQIAVTAIPLGDANVTSRKLYRRSAGAGLKLVDTGASLSNNTTTTYTDTAANAALGAAPLGTSTAYLQRIALSAIPTGGACVTQRKVYRTLAGGTTFKLLTTIANNVDTTYADTSTDATIAGAASAPSSNTATANQVAITGVPIGAAAVTSRKIYRTKAGLAALLLQQTIAENTTTTGVTDVTADAALGAAAPVTDASGLAQSAGQVIAGSTTLIVAGTGAFPSAGWAVIGNGEQVIRYTGVTGSSLTGIPASGAGAIVASVGYNSNITASPQLTGIPASGTGSILYAILKGDGVNLFVTRNDTAAQAVLAALIGGDGIQEDYIQDRRLAQTECETRGDAQLALRSTTEESIQYRCRDKNTRAGRMIRVDLLSPTSVSASYRIQSVTISNFVPAIMPNYDVRASSTSFSYEDLMRRIVNRP